MRILPRRKVFGKEGQTGVSVSSGKRYVKAGLFVPPIQTGVRGVGWIEAEVQEIIGARVRGASDDAIRVLVKDLVAARQKTGA